MDHQEQSITPKPRKLFRVLGVILGVLFVVVGVMIWGKYSSGWLSYGGPIGMIGTGVYFINYGVRGRETLFGRR